MSFPTWKTNTGNSYVFPKTVIDGSIDVSGTFYNRAANVIIGNPDDNYSSTFGSINCSQVQTQTFKNEQISGTVNGFMISQTEILYLTTSGSFSDGVSKISGPGVTDICLNTIDTNTNIMTLYDSGTIPAPSKTENMYITDTNKLLFYNKEGIINDQGIQFTVEGGVTNDFVSEVSYNEIFLTNTNTLTPTSSTSITGYIQKNNNNYYLVTSNTITNDNFLEGYRISDISQNPCIITTTETTKTNQYKILQTSGVINNVVEESIKQTHSGFNYGNKFFLLHATYNLKSNDFVEGTNVELATTITLSGTDYYTYSAGTTVTDSVTFLTNKEGIYVSPNFYLFDGFNLMGENDETISNGDGVFITDIFYGFLDAVNDKYSTFSKTNLQDNTSSQIIGYISSDSKFVTIASIDDIRGTIIINSSNPTNGISKIDSVTANLRVFNLNHNDVGTIVPTTENFTKTGYLFNETTLVLTDTTSLGTEFFFEIENVSVFGLHSSTDNYHNTITNSSSSPITTDPNIGTFEGAVINYNGTYIYAHGKSSDISLNDIIYNSSFVDASSVGIIVSDPTTDRSNTYKIDYKGILPSESTNTTVDAFFIDGKIYLSSDVSDNDIIGTATIGYFNMVGSCLTQQTYYVDLDYYPSSLQGDMITGGNYYVNSSNTIYVEKTGPFGSGGSYTNYIAVYDSGNIFDRIITNTTTYIDTLQYHVFTMTTTISNLSLSGTDFKIFKIPSRDIKSGEKYGNVSWSTNTNSTGNLIIEDTNINYNTNIVGAVIFTNKDEFLGFVKSKSYDGRTWTLTMSRTFTSNLYNGKEVYAHLYKDTEYNIHSPVSFDVYTPINIDIYQDNINLYDSQNYNFYKTVENKSYEPRTFQQYEKIACSVYTNSAYSATTKTSINFPPLTSTDTFVTENYPQTLTNKNFSGNVGIGTTTPTEALDVNGNIGLVGSGAKYIRGASDILTLESEYALKIKSDWNNNNPTIPADIIFYTGASERMIIKRDTGNVGIGTTNPQKTLHLHDSVSAGIRFTSSDSLYRHFQMYTGSNGLYFQAPHDDGNVHWRNAGYIAATSSNDWYSFAWNFTGQHRTFIENVLHTDASNNQGLIVCANKNTYMSMSNKLEKGNNAITQNESLPLVSLSTKSKDKSCFGVISDSEDPEQRSDKFGNFVTPYEKEKGDTRIYINSVGEGSIWVSNKNGPLESGDYITTSDIPGYGEKQDDDILHNYTVAKITMDCDFNPQPQPKEIILKQEILDPSGNTIYENVLDDNGMLQWTNKLDGSGNIVYEYPYNLRYLDLSGNRYSKEEYNTKLANNEEVYIAAYVGCTYHCG